MKRAVSLPTSLSFTYTLRFVLPSRVNTKSAHSRSAASTARTLLDCSYSSHCTPNSYTSAAPSAACSPSAVAGSVVCDVAVSARYSLSSLCSSPSSSSSSSTGSRTTSITLCVELVVCVQQWRATTRAAPSPPPLWGRAIPGRGGRLVSGSERSGKTSEERRLAQSNVGGGSGRGGGWCEAAAASRMAVL